MMTVEKRTNQYTSLIILSFALLLRILVGIHPHSGHDDYQGPTVPAIPNNIKYGGDYEAQRHWMELTYHLPISEWYFYDLDYWGLDYPPLSAYVSWVFGWIADVLGSIRGLGILKQLVALDSSRGIEDPRGKMYMRFTVLIMDLLVYISALWFLAPRLINTKDKREAEKQWSRLLIMTLSQPAIVLIDHGHFQYNTVSLGLALWSFYFITLHTNPFQKNTREPSFVGPIIGSILFSLALNFKQMELYHAPAVFAYLLGRCFLDNEELSTKNVSSTRGFATKFCALGATVMVTFALLWFPYAIYPRSNNTTQFHLNGIKQVIKRLFPFQRGLFEGKVANLWCTLSVKPFSIRQRIPESSMPFLALGLTLMLILPPCWLLFRVGRGEMAKYITSTKKSEQSHAQSHTKTTELKFILWGSTATSLAFYLSSFQVHEKGILIPLSPLSLLVLDAPHFIIWFSVVATWTLWPLVVIDRLGIAYACCITIFLCLNSLTSKPTTLRLDVVETNITKYTMYLSWMCMVFLHVMELWVVPPINLPDLFPVLWSIAGCGMFLFSYLITIWVMANMDKYSIVQKTRNDSTTRAKQHVPVISMLGVALVAVAMFPTSNGYLLPRNTRVCIGSHLSGSKTPFFAEDMLERARAPLYWETQRVEDGKPILDLSRRDSDELALSEKVLANRNTSKISTTAVDTLSFTKGSEQSDTWENGHVWLETESQLLSMGLLQSNTDLSDGIRDNRMKSETMISLAPQLIRLSTSDVIESATFFLDKKHALAPLIQIDPKILTYHANDLYYGIEYLSNMMTRGNTTQAIQLIQTQCSLAPEMALSLFLMGIDGGIDERRVANALGKAASASSKAAEFVVKDLGNTYRDYKRLKDGI